MKRLLVILGLAIIPFYEIFLHMLPFVNVVAPDSRVTKEIISLVFALSIGLLAVYEGKIKPFRNKFFLIIPVYLLLNIIMSPHGVLNINNNDVDDFYFWKPFSEVLCFTFMIIAVASMEIDFNEILKVMTICGAVMAGYIILQKLGLDQFWINKQGGAFTSVRAQSLGGNLGQPTIVASWIVMMIPLAIYLKRWWMTILMVLACLLTQSVMVIGAIFVIGMIYAVRFSKIFIVPIILLLIVLSSLVITHKSQVISRMDGRYEVWKNTINDIRNGQITDGHKFSITGIGFGRFSFIAPSRHNSNFQQVHNDVLEFIYDCGLIGGYLLLAGIFIMIFNIGKYKPVVFSILLSFIGVFFCSLGSFPFQLGAHQFYSAILVGLLHNDSIIVRRS